MYLKGAGYRQYKFSIINEKTKASGIFYRIELSQEKYMYPLKCRLFVTSCDVFMFSALLFIIKNITGFPQGLFITAGLKQMKDLVKIPILLILFYNHSYNIVYFLLSMMSYLCIFHKSMFQTFYIIDYC